MKKLLILLSYVLLSVCVSYAQVTVHTKLEWREFVSEAGRFKAIFPAEPDTIKSQAGLNGTIRKTQITAAFPQIAFMLIYADFPGTPAMNDEALRNDYDVVQNGTASVTSSKLISKRDIWLSGKLGREITLKTGAQIVKYRLHLIGDRQYQVITSFDAVLENDKQTQINVDRFLQSFQLIEKHILKSSPADRTRS